MANMTPEEHQARHIELHRRLDELIADMIATTKMLPSTTSVAQLMHWSHEQTLAPKLVEGHETVH